MEQEQKAGEENEKTEGGTVFTFDDERSKEEEDVMQRGYFSKPPSPPRILSSMSNYLIKKSKPRLFVASILGYFLCVSVLIYVESYVQDSVNAYTSRIYTEPPQSPPKPLQLLDYTSFYTSAKLHETLQSYGSDGRAWYTLLLVAEIPFIAAYSTMLSVFASSAAWKFSEDDEWNKLINLLPFVVAVVDLAETILLAICTIWFGFETKWVKEAAVWAGKATLLKWSLARFCGVLSVTSVLYNYGPAAAVEIKTFVNQLLGRGPKVMPDIRPGQKLPPGMLPKKMSEVGKPRDKGNKKKRK